jgi:hypothetical protein
MLVGRKGQRQLEVGGEKLKEIKYLKKSCEKNEDAMDKVWMNSRSGHSKRKRSKKVQWPKRTRPIPGERYKRMRSPRRKFNKWKAPWATA